MKFDDVLQRYFSKFGQYQALQFFLLAVPCILISAESMSWTFTGANIPHRCLVVNEKRGQLPFDVINATGGEWSEKLECERPQNLSVSKVNASIGSQAEEMNLLDTNDTEGCRDGYYWLHNEIQYSGIERWSIVCDRKWIQSFIQSTYYIGQMIGSVALGYFADRYGRKICFIAAVLLRGCASVLMAFVPYWEAFATLRCITGFCHAGTFVLSVVLGKKRNVERFSG